MALDDAAVGDGLVDDDPALPLQQFAQRRGDEDRVDALRLRRLCLGGGDRGLFVGVPLLLGRTARPCGR
ncbi:hypothetical protein [Streptomyces prunicolor]|uniref:hypothetical protein n=1 Tax=Streptomyces prunicolor TaxID=67348 RepID=UPI00036A2E61|nr:hypothetical protein [Streptomyces prunicolor]